MCVFIECFSPSKPGDIASPVAAAPSQTTHAGQVKERRAASTVAAWSTNAKPALSKTHTGSAGEFREHSLRWVRSFHSILVPMRFNICTSELVPLRLSLFSPSSHRSNTKRGGKHVSHRPLFKAKAKRKSGAARRAKKIAALSVWLQHACSVLSVVQSKARSFFHFLLFKLKWLVLTMLAIVLE